MTSSTRHPLDVILVSGEYPPDPGGVGDYTRLLGQALIARGHRCTVVTGGSSLRQIPSRAPGDPHVIAAGGNWSWRSLGRIVAAIHAHKPDVVHIQYQAGAYGMRPAINFLPALLHRLPQVPRAVVTAHDLRLPYLLPKAGMLRRWVTGRLLGDAYAVIVTNAEDQRRLAGEGVPDRELYLARRPLASHIIPIGSNIAPAPPEGYDRERWRHSLGVREGEVVVVFFGLPTPSKGLLELVQAMAATPDHVRLHIVGGEPRHSVEQDYWAQVQMRIDLLWLQDRIFRIGYSDPPAVSAHLLAADIGALPFQDGASYRRGSLLAMLAHGIPLVTTRPQLPLIPPIVHEEHALLVAPGDERELAEAVARLALDAELRARLAHNGRALSTHFSWPEIAAAHEAVYRTLL